TMDTLDYSGVTINRGSKLVVAAAGEKKRSLANTVPGIDIGDGFSDLRMVRSGILSIRGPAFQNEDDRASMEKLCHRISEQMKRDRAFEGWPLIIVSDDSEFCARTFDNFLWVTFTRSNPSHDVYGVDSSYTFKHWGCSGPLIIDARRKPHHAPPLDSDPEISQRVDALGAPGGPLHGII
ncbi:MAG: 3-octaprenyl-4-hydroxybenzoate carboxy-lyase, partial [Leptospiraceae bacterium]|nr:3-octaprenyl-4-hydroxybenzoate carboxy-lyase [Leptospiraceae bacterium]